MTTNSTHFNKTDGVGVSTYGNGMAIADHTLHSDLESLLQKVNLNSAFTNLAKHDQALVTDMKTAIVELYRQSKRREVLYIAIEHNTKYLTSLAQASDLAKNEAMAEIQKLKGEYAKLKIDSDEMGRKIKTLSKDSEQLQMER